jgi:hypothetical protein
MRADCNSCIYHFDKIYIMYKHNNIDQKNDITSYKENNNIFNDLFNKMPLRLSKLMIRQFFGGTNSKITGKIVQFNQPLFYYIQRLLVSGDEIIVVDLNLIFNEVEREDFCIPFAKININKIKLLQEIFYKTFYECFGKLNSKVILKLENKLILKNIDREKKIN